MQFLKILFWCLLAFVAAVFTFGNWTSVPVRLFGGLIAEVNLPLLLFATFLIGLLPTLLFQHAVRWRQRQRIVALERALAEIGTPPPPTAPVQAAAPIPGIVPPGGA